MNELTMKEFDKSIGGEESFWHDYNLDVSSNVLDQFSLNDWTDLKKIVLTRQKYWQERCAEAIGYMDNVNGVDVLMLILESPYMSAAAIAASELNNMSIVLPKIFENRLLSILEYLTKNRSSRCDDVRQLIVRLA